MNRGCLFVFMLDDCVGALTAYNAILLGLKFDGCVLNCISSTVSWSITYFLVKTRSSVLNAFQMNLQVDSLTPSATSRCSTLKVLMLFWYVKGMVFVCWHIERC
jgi:hypothetical protein